ncbi:hypothetical protein ACFL2M_01175 [Patescibacteria group bacterium]
MVKKKIALPTRAQCQEIWDRYRTPLHIREHMKQANRVAVFLARKLKKAGENVNIDLVDRASLLHDTIRVTDMEPGSFERFPYTPSQEEITAWKKQCEQFPPDVCHDQVNYEIFKEQFPEMAQVIRVHGVFDAPNVKTWEEKLVNYGDRRASHDKIVTVKERISDGEARYAAIHGRVSKTDPAAVKATYAIEQEIYSIIGGDPDKLNYDLENEPEQW